MSDLQASITEMLHLSPEPNAEEYAIQDFKDFGALRISEHDSVKSALTWAKFIVEHGKLGAELIVYCDSDIDQTTILMEDCYHGAYNSESDFVRDFLDETGTLMPETLCFYIDYEAMARDWFVSDYFSLCVNGEVHVFSSY